MKIRPDQIEALKQQERIKSKPKLDQDGFEDMLAQEVRKQPDAGKAAGTAPPPGARLGSLLSVEETTTVETSTQSERAVMENIDSLLNKWEKYAEGLKTPDTEEGLRQAFGVLENISDEVGQLKQSWPNLGQDNPGLQSVVDEIEILAVTEKFKFNRGDYL